MSDNTIINSFYQKIFICDNLEEQINLIQLYPIFNVDLLVVWEKYYSHELLKILKLSEKISVLSKKNDNDELLEISEKISEKISVLSNENDPDELLELSEMISISNQNSILEKKKKLLEFIILYVLRSDCMKEKVVHLVQFLESHKEKDTEIEKLKKAFLEKRSRLREEQKPLITFLENERKQKVARDFISFSAKDIAHELTYRTLFLIKHISISEIIEYTCTVDKEIFVISASNSCLGIMLCDSNKLKNIIITALVMDNKNSHKLKCLKKFIKVCRELKKLNNYHCFTALMHGLNHPSVQNMSFLWKPEGKHTHLFQELQNIGHHDKLHSAEDYPIGIPHLPTFLTHLFALYRDILETANMTTYRSATQMLSDFKNIPSFYGHQKIKTNLIIGDWFSGAIVCTDENLLNAISDEENKKFIADKGKSHSKPEFFKKTSKKGLDEKRNTTSSSNNSSPREKRHSIEKEVLELIPEDKKL